MRCIGKTGQGSSKWDKITAAHACQKVTIQEQGSTSTFKVIEGDNLQNAATAPTMSAGTAFSFFKRDSYAAGEVVGYIQWTTGTPAFTQTETNAAA